MELTKIKEVKDPEATYFGGYKLFIPEENFPFPGVHYLAPSQSVIIKSGLEAAIPEDCVLLPIDTFRKTGSMPLAIAGVPASEVEMSFQITNIGDDIAELTNGGLLATVMAFPKYSTNKKVDMVNFLGAVRQFHKTFGHPVLDSPEIPAKDRVELRLNLLKEELEELQTACENGDLVEAADAFADLQYVLSGAIHEFGMGEKFPEIFMEVHRSNMSKACRTLTEAEDTVKYWTDQGQPCYHKEIDGRFLVYRNSDNKTLKSISYSPAKIKELVVS